MVDSDLESCTNSEADSGDEKLVIAPPVKDRKVEEITVSENALQKAITLREVILKTWLWESSRLTQLVGAVENQPVSVALMERTGISLLLRPEIWACVPGSEVARIAKVRKRWKKLWQDQRQFCSGKVFEGKIPGHAAEVKLLRNRPWTGILSWRSTLAMEWQPIPKGQQ